jgi:GNAT superfamily N-acetyltransferase
MATIERILTEPAEPYSLRPPRIGDIGWVIHRQAVLYQQEYGWNGDFEVLLAEIFAAMMRTFDPSRERGWIAERGGEAVGSVYVVRQSDTVAKLRLLYVDPSARGLGIGRRLVHECIAFARGKAYRSMTLWTNDPLVAARRIYVEAGFDLVASEPVHAFGKDMVSETWELAL